MGTLVCRIDIDKKQGFTLLIDNPSDGIKQTITLDGTTLQMKVDDGSSTSTYTQDAESVSVACKRFTVEAEESVRIDCQGTVDVVSKDAMTAESEASLDLKAQGDMGLDTQQTLTCKGAVAASFQAPDVQAKADNALSLEGQVTADLKAVTVKVDAQAQMDLSSGGVANLKGSLTNIQGSLIKAG